MTCSIQTRGLGFSYEKSVSALISGMDIAIGTGTVTAILGPNGAGKTTLLHLFLGILKPSHGQLFFFGRPVHTFGPGQLKQLIGLVSQNETIPFDMSLEDYVLLGRAPHKKMLEIPGENDRKIAADALETVGMMHMKTCGMTQLSSGEKQLVNVARALAQVPDILLLDEPCSHLDLINSRKMLKLMKSMATSGRTVVFTTHDPNAASAIADNMLLIRNGARVAQGAPYEVINQTLLSKTYGDSVEVMDTQKGPMVMTI